MNKDYEKLILQFAKKGYEISEEQAKEIYKQQKKDQESILDLISKILLSYTILDSVLKVGDKDRNKLRNDFNEKISLIVKNEHNQEKDVMKNILQDVTKEKYYSSAYTMNIGVNFKLQKIDDDDIQKIVEEKIDGEVWSDRLWNNKKALENNLKQQSERFLQGKTNVNKIEKVIKDRFNQNAFNTHRLVQTEIARCQTAANEVFAQKHNIKQQMFCATLDSRTSEICRGYDGKIFDVDDSSKPTPPLHPFCRSCLINVPNSDWKPTERLDNITKEKIPYMTYEKWYEKNVKNNSQAIIEEKKIKNKSTDKKLYYKYKEILGKEMPKTLEEFQNLKYNDVNGWDKIKQLYSDTNSGKVWLKAEFFSQNKFNRHITKHLQEYGDITEEEYLNIARKLLASPIKGDIDGFKSDLGFIFRYNKSTNDFAIGRADGKISTLFKPKDGREYWLQQIKDYKEV